MLIFHRKVVGTLILMVFLLFGVPGWAEVATVTTTPTGKNVPLVKLVTVSFVWRVTTQSGGGLTISSPSGVFRTLSGVTLGTVSKTLSTPTTGGPTTRTLSETISVPAHVIFGAQKSGFNRLVYARTFSDGSGPSGTGSINLNLTGPSGGELNITRIQLRFEDRSAVKMVARNEPAPVFADILFSGSGFIQATWELADPSSTMGEPVFRPLKTVRRYLLAGRNITLESPKFPTQRTGLYLARLRITKPTLGFDIPVIRYFVKEVTPDDEEQSHLAKRIPIILTEPENRAKLKGNTQFTWKPVRGAKAYQLELYLKASPQEELGKAPSQWVDNILLPTTHLSEAPLAGAVVPAGQTVISLSRPTRDHLQKGQHYLWRVVVIGKDGKILGVSPVREFYVP